MRRMMKSFLQKYFFYTCLLLLFQCGFSKSPSIAVIAGSPMAQSFSYLKQTQMYNNTCIGSTTQGLTQCYVLNVCIPCNEINGTTAYQSYKIAASSSVNSVIDVVKTYYTDSNCVSSTSQFVQTESFTGCDNMGLSTSIVFSCTISSGYLNLSYISTDACQSNLDNTAVSIIAKTNNSCVNNYKDSTGLIGTSEFYLIQSATSFSTKRFSTLNCLQSSLQDELVETVDASAASTCFEPIMNSNDFFLDGSFYSRAQIVLPPIVPVEEEGSATRYYGALAAAMILIFSFGLCIVYREKIREYWNEKVLGKGLPQNFQPIDLQQSNASSPFHDADADDNTTI